MNGKGKPSSEQKWRENLSFDPVQRLTREQGLRSELTNKNTIREQKEMPGGAGLLVGERQAANGRAGRPSDAAARHHHKARSLDVGPVKRGVEAKRRGRAA